MANHPAQNASSSGLGGRAYFITKKRTVVPGVLAALVLCSCLLAGCLAPAIKASRAKGKVAFRITKGSPGRRAKSIRVWSYTRDIYLWTVEVNSESGWRKRKELIEYGVIPTGYGQNFPENGMAPPLMEEDEQIVIDMVYIEEALGTPGIDRDRKHFRYRNGRLVPDKPSHYRSWPSWSSVEQRQQFQESIRHELEPGPEEAQFLKVSRMSRPDAAQATAYAILFRLMQVQDPVHAYLNLRHTIDLRIGGNPNMRSFGPKLPDVSLLQDLVQLERLHIGHATVTDLSPLAGLKALKYLQLRGVPVENIEWLAGMQQLQLLHIEDGRISDISVLAKLSSIGAVRLPGNSIVDVSPLRHSVKLTQLNLSRNRISDVGALIGLPQLKLINVSGNRITDVGPLVEHFRRLVESMPVGKNSHYWLRLNVRGNPITNAELLDKPWMRKIQVIGP